MGTRNPADVLERKDLGRVAIGAKADFVLWMTGSESAPPMFGADGSTALAEPHHPKTK